MARIYSKDVIIHATVYVRAESAEQAQAIINNTVGNGQTAQLPIGEGIGVTISGRCFDDPRLPDISLSPAVTFGVDYDPEALPDPVE